MVTEERGSAMGVHWPPLLQALSSNPAQCERFSEQKFPRKHQSKKEINIVHRPSDQDVNCRAPVQGVISSVRPASVAQLGALSDWRPGGRGFNPRRGRQHSFVEIDQKYFLRSFSPFRWFKKGSCQFLAKECAQYWLTA